MVVPQVVAVLTLLIVAPSLAAAETRPQPLPSRRMDELTSREVQLYFQRGGDLVLVPFGPISGHGAFIPTGMHNHWAHALALLIAERADGLVHPPVFSCYSGATRSFRGSVSFPVDEQEEVLVRIVKTLQAQGFKRVVLVAGTHPEDTGGVLAARRVFDETEHPIWLLSGEKLLAEPAVKAVSRGYPAEMGETQLAFAALKVLGRERAVPYPDWAREVKKDEPDQPPEIAADVARLRHFGAVGFRFYEEGNHGNHGTVGLVHQGKRDIDLAVEVLHKSAEVAQPALESLRRYVDWIGKRPFRFVVPVDRLSMAGQR